MAPRCGVCSSYFPSRVDSCALTSSVCVCENGVQQSKRNGGCVQQNSRGTVTNKPVLLLTPSSKEFKLVLDGLHCEAIVKDEDYETTAMDKSKTLKTESISSSTKADQRLPRIKSSESLTQTFCKSDSKTQQVCKEEERASCSKQADVKVRFPCIHAQSRRNAAANVARQRSFRVLKSVWWADEDPELELTTVHKIHSRPSRVTLLPTKSRT